MAITRFVLVRILLFSAIAATAGTLAHLKFGSPIWAFDLTIGVIAGSLAFLVTYRPAKSDAAFGLVQGSLFVIGTFVVLILILFTWRSGRFAQSERLRERDLPITIHAAQPIIQAISWFEKANGRPPASLEDLVHAYLSRIPPPGPVAEDGWIYEVTDDTRYGGWTLRVEVRDEYSPNIMGFGDMFVYHPDGKYPEYKYGGVLVRYRGWGYYVE